MTGNREQQPFDRTAMVDAVRNRTTPWDMIIVGGGASGLGTAVDAAARGYDVLLLEQADFAKGTSSRSTKLVHGGVRYLAQRNIRLVLDALYERGLMLQNAPHLVHDQRFVVPVYSHFDKLFYGTGLKTYDLLSRKLSFGRSLLLNKRETADLVPNLDPAGLKGGVLYHDGQFDDARLALNLAQTAAACGAVLLNYVPVLGLMKTGEQVTGVEALDLESGVKMSIPAKIVINATGPFADEIRLMEDGGVKKAISASQGIHVVLDRSFLNGDVAIMVPKTDDGRVLFAIPWHDHVVVGTTDTPIDQVTLEPRALDEEVEFVLSHAARYMTRDPRREDVLSVFVGIRPLVSNPDAATTAALSRDHSLFASKGNLVTICGGKWTTYRRMAEDTVNLAAKVAALDDRPCVTRELRLHGHTSDPAADTRKGVYGSDHLSAARGRCHRADTRTGVYGSDWAALARLEESQPDNADRIHTGLNVTRGQVVWAVRHEMARTIEDVLSRRTRALILNARAAHDAAPVVAEIMAAEMGRDASWRQEQVTKFQTLAEQYILQ